MFVLPAYIGHSDDYVTANVKNTVHVISAYLFICISFFGPLALLADSSYICTLYTRTFICIINAM